MDEATFRDHLLAVVKEVAAALVDQSRAIEALAVAVQRQGRQGTLRVKVEAPVTKKRRKARVRA